jgi:ABC-2 type transport system ATP-binding protein
MLQIEKLLKKYNEKVILNIESFHLQGGNYWLKGANGSGKSTLLKIIAGLIPFEGNIICNTTSFKKNSIKYKKLISYHAADAALPPYLTGMDLLQFYGAVRNVKNQDIAQTITLFRLNDFVKQKIGTYSSGMQKRLSLSLAFVGHPYLIMLDEPLSTLDVDITQLMSEIIKRYHTEGSNFIITSHQDFEYNSINFTNQLLVEKQQLSILS